MAAGIYATNGPEACQFVAKDCKANIIVVENQKQLDKILEVHYLVIHVITLHCICARIYPGPQDMYMAC